MVLGLRSSERERKKERKTERKKEKGREKERELEGAYLNSNRTPDKTGEVLQI